MTQDLLPLLDLFGIFVFAITGAVAAARLKQNFVTFCFFAVVTGVGGGTLRDLLISAPVFWVNDGRALAACLMAALIVWFTPKRWWENRALEMSDAAGLAAYAVFGAWKALAFGVSPFVAGAMGVVTACMGGIVRDLLAGTPSILLRPELYVTAAALAAAVFLVLHAAGVDTLPAAVVAALAGFALRAAAIIWKLGLPDYRK